MSITESMTYRVMLLEIGAIFGGLEVAKTIDSLVSQKYMEAIISAIGGVASVYIAKVALTIEPLPGPQSTPQNHEQIQG